MRLLIFALFICQHLVDASVYSVGVYATEKVVNAGSSFTNIPSAHQIADVCARLSGAAPLLWEDKFNLPVMESHSRPTIVEIKGGVLPEEVSTVLTTADSVVPLVASPQLNDVVTILKKHELEFSSKTINGNDKDVLLFLKAQKGPVIVLHQMNVVDTMSSTINMLDSSNSTTVTPLTETQISQYQICLWTGVGFVLLLLAAVGSIVNMEVIPDSLLYAKFQSGRTGEKRD